MSATEHPQDLVKLAVQVSDFVNSLPPQEVYVTKVEFGYAGEDYPEMWLGPSDFEDAVVVFTGEESNATS